MLSLLTSSGSISQLAAVMKTRTPGSVCTPVSTACGVWLCLNDVGCETRLKLLPERAIKLCSSELCEFTL